MYSHMKRTKKVSVVVTRRRVVRVGIRQDPAGQPANSTGEVPLEKKIVRPPTTAESESR